MAEKLRDKVDDQKEQIKRLNDLLDQAEQRLQKQYTFALPDLTLPSLNGKTNGLYKRLIIPDTHGCFIETEAWEAVMQDCQLMDIREVIHLGDAIDCGGFLSQNHTWGFVAEMDYSFDEDISATNQMFDQLQTVAPHADFHYLEGNHEHRIEKWCVTVSRGNKKDAERLKRMNTAPNVLSLDKRGIKYYEQSEFYDGCQVPATIRLENCYFQHGTVTSKHAASGMLDLFTDNVVFGHTHRQDLCVQRNVRSIVGAWNPGCLCRLQPLWGNTRPFKWSHGYAIQIVDEESGDFLHLNIPIIGGKSMFSAALNDSKKLQAAINAK
jgi:predicted phosphodiesterase